MIHLLRMLFAVFVLAGLFMAPVAAQTTPDPAPITKIDKRKLLVQPRNADGSLVMVSFRDDPILWMREQQQAFYGSMAGALRNVRTSGATAAAWTLMVLSFGYGIFHPLVRATGKAVISAWLLATENELKRGIFIAFISSIIQALSAIAIVSVLLLIVGGAARNARDIAGFLESASYAMIAAMGLYLIWTALRPRHVHAEEIHAHDHHDHHHVHDEHCGHNHVPEAKQVRGEWSLTKAFSLAFAVGIRPCTGAILVLILANTLGIYSVGIAATLVMAIGTFLTVALIATIAVYSKKLAGRLAARDDRWVKVMALTLRIGGGVAIACLGGLLFLGSLGSNSGMM